MLPCPPLRRAVRIFSDTAALFPPILKFGRIFSVMARWIAWTVVVSVALAAPARAMADRCADVAKPATFDKDTAMAAIFCEYDRAKGGTLLPVQHTRTWNLAKAETLATPLLASTYREGGIEKGVLIVQRQMLDESEVVDSHATAAVVSIYIFKRAGARWEFEKGSKEALEAGANGHAPFPEIIRIGDDKFAAWFEGGDIHQGYSNNSAYLVSLTDSIAPIGEFDLGQDNAGSCSDNAKERDESIHACWSYEGKRELLRIKGKDHFTIRIAYSGSETADDEHPNRIVPKNRPVCYAFAGDGYTETTDRSCASAPALAEADVVIKNDRDSRKPASR
jgi:hypothetical protein